MKSMTVQALKARLKDVRRVVEEVDAYLQSPLPIYPSVEKMMIPGFLFKTIAELLNDINRATKEYTSIVRYCQLIKECKVYKFQTNVWSQISADVNIVDDELLLLKDCLYKRMDTLRLNLESVRSIQGNAIQMERAGIRVMNSDFQEITETEEEPPTKYDISATPASIPGLD